MAARRSRADGSLRPILDLRSRRLRRPAKPDRLRSAGTVSRWLRPSMAARRSLLMRVCVVGGGGREHALALALGRAAEVVVTPGNLGIPGSTPAPPEEIDADLFVIGPEITLVEGLADRLRGPAKWVLG